MRATNHSVPVDYIGYDTNQWPDHRLRVMVTGAMVAAEQPNSVIDPACGDGKVVAYARRLIDIPYATLGDISKENIDKVPHQSGDILCIGDAVQTLHGNREKDVVILSETIEHVKSPKALLDAAYGSARRLVASSPVIPQGGWDDNAEHLWMFDEEEYAALIESSGWKIDAVSLLRFPGLVYDFQIVRAHR